MLDIRLIREDPKLVEENLKKRGDFGLIEMLNSLVKQDKERRDLLTQLDHARHQRNILTQKMAELKSKGEDTEEVAAAAKEAAETIKQLEKKAQELDIACNGILMRLPNMLDDSVPQGKDDKENVELRKWGSKPIFDFEPKGHEELALGIDGLELERAAKISGSRFYFLKNQLLMLHWAVLGFALDHLMKKGYTAIQPPYLLKREPYEGVVALEDFEHVMYKIENEDLYLIATSEHPLVTMKMKETFLESDLPLKLAGISPCFRKEAGAHGKDMKGIYRVHQFEKVEQVIFCKPQDSKILHEELMKNTEEIFQALELPYRVVNVCTGDIGTIASKKYDLEVWMPVQRAHREMGSCSSATDYQARRLSIKYRKEEGQVPVGFVHTLNNTGIASPRILAAILENYQRANGSIVVPKVLRPYVGLDRIEKK